MLWCMLCVDAWGLIFFHWVCFRMQQPPYYYTIDGSVSKSLHKSTCCPASRYSVTTTFTKKWIFVTFFSCCWGPTFLTAQINAGKMAAGFFFDAHSTVVHCTQANMRPLLSFLSRKNPHNREDWKLRLS